MGTTAAGAVDVTTACHHRPPFSASLYRCTVLLHRTEQYFAAVLFGVNMTVQPGRSHCFGSLGGAVLAAMGAYCGMLAG